MSLDVVQFKPNHFRELVVQNQQEDVFAKIMDPANDSSYDYGDYAWTGYSPEGIVMCGGLIPRTEVCADGWVLISKFFPKYVIPYTRKVIEKLDMIQRDHGFHRIQASVDLEFTQGHRWAKLLGFKPEGVMRKYRPGGLDSMLYGRIVG